VGAGLDSGSKDYRNDRVEDNNQNITTLSFQRMRESNFLFVIPEIFYRESRGVGAGLDSGSKDNRNDRVKDIFIIPV